MIKAKNKEEKEEGKRNRRSTKEEGWKGNGREKMRMGG